MTVWRTRTYTDNVSGDPVARYVSLDGELWTSAFTYEEMEAREEARRAILTDPASGTEEADPESGE